MNYPLPHMARWILAFGEVHTYLVYAVVFFLASAEGPWLSLIAGVLIKLGAFGFWPLYIALMVGDLAGDAIWYFVGRRYGRPFIARYGQYVNINGREVERMTRRFHRHQHSVLFLSKVSNGFGFALVTLITAGMVKIPFGRYMLVNLSGQFIWTGLLIGVGFFFTHLLTTVNSVLGRIAIAAAAVILATIGCRYCKYLRRRGKELGD